MLDQTQLQKIGQRHPWVKYLINYGPHYLSEYIMEFYPQDIISGSYLYLGELERNQVNKTICIVHYHSSYRGPVKFMNIQNLDSYRNIVELDYQDITNLSINVTKDSVINLNNPDALTLWHLDKVNAVDYFYIVDESGFVKNYSTFYQGG